MQWVIDDHMTKVMLEDFVAGMDAKGPKPLPHLTELISCLTKSYYNRYDPLPINPQTALIFVMGIGLEEALLRPHKEHKSGQVDGIYYEADFLTYRDTVGELKSTRVSAKKEPKDFPETWTKQLLGYLKCLSKNEATLAVFHAMGSYNPPFPVLKVWHGIASPQEIDDNWRWLQERKAVYLDHIARGEVPKQFVYNEEWECENCAYLIICQAKQSIEDLRAKEVK